MKFSLLEIQLEPIVNIIKREIVPYKIAKDARAEYLLILLEDVLLIRL